MKHKDDKYALGALEELRKQLEVSKKDSKRAKIQERIRYWLEFLKG